MKPKRPETYSEVYLRYANENRLDEFGKPEKKELWEL